ncbi:MAG: hypothetical protein KME04_02390 [Pleurocapsa minor GSE-CHR-MK-17-07R]|nr:hypothetical protein [Pleurocapsa minor GSE-CHR-MK 17-07R]
MRYFISGTEMASLPELGALFLEVHEEYLLLADPIDENSAELYFGEVLLGELEVNRPGDDLFDGDLEDLLDELNKQDDPAAVQVSAWLEEASGMLVIHVLRGGHEQYDTLMSPLIDSLFARYDGVLQVDTEGFFNRDGRIVSLL